MNFLIKWRAWLNCESLLTLSFTIDVLQNIISNSWKNHSYEVLWIHTLFLNYFYLCTINSCLQDHFAENIHERIEWVFITDIKCMYCQFFVQITGGAEYMKTVFEQNTRLPCPDCQGGWAKSSLPCIWNYASF